MAVNDVPPVTVAFSKIVNSASPPQLSIKEIQKDIYRTITNDNFKTKTGIIPKLYYYNDVFVDATEISEIKKTLSVYLSSSLPVPPLRFLRAKTTLF